MELLEGANPFMAGIHAVTRRQEPAEPRHFLAGNYQNLARPGSCPARFVGRYRPLSELVVGGRLGRI